MQVIAIFGVGEFCEEPDKVGIGFQSGGFGRFDEGV
jgi:hypothetical protein